MEFSPGTGGDITGVYFYSINMVGNNLAAGSGPYDFAVINTTQDLSQYVTEYVQPTAYTSASGT